MLRGDSVKLSIHSEAVAARRRNYTSGQMRTIWNIVAFASNGTLRLRYPRAERELYLTFDDGPNPVETPRLLDLLARHDVRATFFMIGNVVERFPDVAKAVVDAGHALGNHSMTHPWFNRISAQEQLREIDAADAVLASIDGRPVHTLRPPHGRATFTSVRSAKQRNTTLLLWSHDSLDYKLSGEQVLERLNGFSLQGGEVMLFHDDGGAAHYALERAIPRWKAAGFRFGVPTT